MANRARHRVTGARMNPAGRPDPQAPLVPERATGSFAGGLAVAYVFLHLLPDLVEGKKTLGEALSESWQQHYPRRFAVRGRLVLAGALLAGWTGSAIAAPTNTLLVALLTALLGGSVLLNVFKEEVPSGRRASFAWFLVGLVLYASLLAVLTGVQG